MERCRSQRVLWELPYVDGDQPVAGDALSTKVTEYFAKHSKMDVGRVKEILFPATEKPQGEGQEDKNCREEISEDDLVGQREGGDIQGPGEKEDWGDGESNRKKIRQKHRSGGASGKEREAGGGNGKDKDKGGDGEREKERG
ncbi:unnamed protein product, partial [Discosporangium mesarthrocarpum]